MLECPHDCIPYGGAVKISGPSAIVTALYVFVIFTTLHLVAVSFPDSKIARAYLAGGW